ncbi:MAG: putative 2OG-Fe(II) oxygenase [Hyphomonadaceae bacterium]
MNAEAILYEAYQRFSAGDPRGAEVALAPLWNASPRRPAKAIHLLGMIRRAQGRLPEAEALLRQAIEADPADPEPLNNLGNLLYAAKKYEEAAAIYRRALSIAPRMEQAQLNLVYALNQARAGEEGEIEARKLLKLRRTAEGLQALGAALGMQAKHAEALAAIEEALARRPEFPIALYDRAVALNALGRKAEAYEAFDKLAARPDAGPQIFLSWADALAHGGESPKQVEAALAAGLRLHPLNVSLQRDHARFRWLNGASAQEFSKDIEAALRAAPDNHELRSACAELIYRAGRPREAAQLIQDGLARAPFEAELLRMKAFLEDEADAPALAIQSARGVLRVREDDTTQKLLIHALLRMGEAREALDLARAALRAAPHDQHMIALETTALQALGDPDLDRLYNFERFVHVVDLAAPPGYESMEAFNAALAESLAVQHTLAQHPLNQTLYEGTQTPRELTTVEDAAIQAFLELARQTALAFSKTLPSDPSHPFLSRAKNDVGFAGSWSVRLRPGGHHVNHFHPKGWISSAYYVRLPPRAADDAPHAGWLKFGEPRKPIPGCKALKFVEPKPGRLVLFPSYMWHGTEPFKQGDRLTVAFDIVPK